MKISKTDYALRALFAIAQQKRILSLLENYQKVQMSQEDFLRILCLR